MTIQNDLMKELANTAKEGVTIRRNNIKFLVGQFQRVAKNKEKIVEDSEAIKIMKNLYSSMKEITLPSLKKDGYEYFEAIDFIVLCEELLPKMATESEVIEFLTSIDFKSLKSPMQAIGITVKHFNGNVKPELVRNCLPFLGIYV
jgi:hypothetical protein